MRSPVGHAAALARRAWRWLQGRGAVVFLRPGARAALLAALRALAARSTCSSRSPSPRLRRVLVRAVQTTSPAIAVRLLGQQAGQLTEVSTDVCVSGGLVVVVGYPHSAL